MVSEPVLKKIIPASTPNRSSKQIMGIPIGIPRIGNLGEVNYGIWGSEFEGQSIGIPIGIPRIGNLGG